MEETEELLMEKIRKWKDHMEAKGLRVNIGKTKVMRCGSDGRGGEASGKYPCGVCKKGVGSNSIQCTVCQRWVHKKCCGVKGKLKEDPRYKCPVCLGQVKSKYDTVVEEVELSQGEKLEVVQKFCYLGDMIGSGGGAEEAVRNRVRCAWGKFNQLNPVLCARGVSLKIKGKMYKSCVQSVLIYGSETWPMKVEDSRRLERTERAMVRRMCGVKLAEKVSSVELSKRVGVEGVLDVLRRGRLRWFGHLERMEVDNWVSACRKKKVGGKGGRGRGRKSWMQCVTEDMGQLGLRAEWAMDRVLWRGRIHGSIPTCALHGKGNSKR
jgi:hypothetical protein